MASKVFASLAHFERFCFHQAATANPTLSKAVGLVGQAVYLKAYALFGDKGELQALAPATVSSRARMIRLGVPAPGGTDSPLYFTGKLRAELEFMHVGLVAGVGSPDPIMLWQEMGTARIPSRPILRLSVQTTKDANWLVVRHYAAEMFGINVEGGGTQYAVLGSGANIANQFTGALKGPAHVYLTDHKRGNSSSS